MGNAIDQERRRAGLPRRASPPVKGFFEKQTRESSIKSAIVSKYFAAWSKIMLKRARKRTIAYIDLYSGPGRYRDGKPSTPLLVIEQALKDSQLRDRLVTVFNDHDPKSVTQLQHELERIGAHQLRYPPVLLCSEVDEQLTRELDRLRFPPALSFIDPWGYKGVSLELLRILMRTKGSECVLFFNYRRINPAIENPAVEQRIRELFGHDRATKLKRELPDLSVQGRETLIVSEFRDALREAVAQYVLPFRFLNQRGTRTTHYLIFLTNNPLGIHIMKDIMQREGGTEGSPLEYSRMRETQPELPTFREWRLSQLANELAARFKGRTLSLSQLYYEHHPSMPWTFRDYQLAVMLLEKQGRIRCDPPANMRRPGTLGRNTILLFPVEA